MEQFNKFLLALCMASKVITKEKDAEIIITEKNVTKEKFKTLINQHLLGQKRLGVTPEILRQEDKVMFGGIDIDCPALSEEEKYELALNLQRSLQENYGILALIEKSKSKGFHCFVFFSAPQERTFIKNMLQNVIRNVTDLKISNGEIEVFPKGEKGNAIFLPFFGMFKDEDNFNNDYFKKKRSCFVQGANMEILKNPIDAISQAMYNNDSKFPFLNLLKNYPPCITRAAFNWTKGQRNSLSFALAGILKKVSKSPEDEAANVIQIIAEYNNDEEINDRLNAVKSTYKNDDIAGCSILQGNNTNIALSIPLCNSVCVFVQKVSNIKSKIRQLQKECKGLELKDKLSKLTILEINNTGKIYFSNNSYYLFLKEEKKIIKLSEDSRELKNLLTKWGINAAELLFRYVIQELFAYFADNAKKVDIYKFAYYDSKNFILYLYNNPKLVLKISESSISFIENGDEGILFEELKNYEPFELVEFDKNINYLRRK